MDVIFANQAVSVTELKRNFANILSASAGEPVAVLNHNKPEAYLVPAAYYEKLMQLLEDVEDVQTLQERSAGPFVEVSLNEL